MTQMVCTRRPVEGGASLDAVLFDLDGTLIDTYDLILVTFRHATREVLGRTIPDEELMAKVGQPLATQMWDFTDDASVQQELVAAYREYNARVHGDLIKLFPGTVDMLERLKDAGVPLGVVTSKRHVSAVQGLASFNLEHYFDFLIGSDDWPEHKPHPGPVAHGCDRLGLAHEQVLYVGDSPFDIQSGNAAGCATAAVLWGMFPQGVLAAEHPTYVCANQCELAPLLALPQR